MNVPKLRAPIVLVHGLFGFARLRLGNWLNLEYFNGIPAVLEAAGNDVIVARLSPTRGIAARAQELKSFIQAHYPNDPVHVIAHSMGGLDARYLISNLGMADSVLTLTTLGTPHRGSPFADWASKSLVRLVAPFFDALHLPRDAFDDLTVASCTRFNELTPNAPQVRYFSIAGRYESTGFNPSWHLSGPIVEKAEGPHDGIVSITSATWGESIDVWEGDHVSLINWPQSMLGANVLNRLPQYSALLGRLRDEGF